MEAKIGSAVKGERAMRIGLFREEISAAEPYRRG